MKTKLLALLFTFVILGVSAASKADDACSSDAENFCPGMTTGKPLWKCLKKHKKQLSAACKRDIASKKGAAAHKKMAEPMAPAEGATPETKGNTGGANNTGAGEEGTAGATTGAPEGAQGN